MKTVIEFQRKPQVSVKQSQMYFLECKVQSLKHLSPRWQITWGLQVFQVQDGEPGSSTEQIHRLLLSTSWPRELKGGGRAVAMYGSAVWEMVRQPSWNEGSSHQGWCLFSYIPWGGPVDRQGDRWQSATSYRTVLLFTWDKAKASWGSGELSPMGLCPNRLSPVNLSRERQL